MNGCKVSPRNKIASSIEGARMIDAAAIANRSTASAEVNLEVIGRFDSIPELLVPGIKAE
jgi:hypothetical protein